MTSKPEAILERPSFGPSDHLTILYKACSEDPAEGIQTRLSCMFDTFMQHYMHDAGDERTKEADKCYHQAGIWYYKILEKLAIEERNRQGISFMSRFFIDELQQKCLVACCLEITVSLNKLPCEFPQLLQLFHLAPHHFGNMIEPLIRAVDHLPETAKKHLTQVEEKILESLAWTSDSPLWTKIKANGGRMLTFPQVMPSNRLEDPGRADVKPESDKLEVVVNPDLQPSTPAESSAQRSKSLLLFLRKFYMLAIRHLKMLCRTLTISDKRQRMIWTCFEHSLVNFPDMMKNRHLDQLLRCAISIMAKVFNEVPVSEEITGGSLKICKNTEENSAAFPTPDTPSAHYPITSAKQSQDFFNHIYSPKMLDFAKQFVTPVGVGSPPLTPLPKATPRQLSNKHKIFISPLKSGLTPQKMSGHTYTFHSSTSECLRKINSVVAGSRIPKKRSCVALRMETEKAEEDDSPPPKVHHSDSQSTLLRRLKDVQNDREAGCDQVQPPESRQPDLN